MSIYLDEGYFLDEAYYAEAVGESEIELDIRFAYRPFEGQEIVGESEIEMDFLYGVALDLLPLIPTKYHDSQILLDYVDEVGFQVGVWLTNVANIVKLLNPNSITSRDYLKQLAYLIGVKLPPEDESTEEEVKQLLLQAIEWYKVKGTYKSIQIVALVQGFTLNIYDMYTNDYSSFYITDWFVGDEGENPPGFDSSYYKSPHFGLEILLNKVYTVGSSGSGSSGGSSYLWRITYLNNLYDRVEDTRPVHTVPHYILFLNPKTDEFEHVIEVEGNIQTKVLGSWGVSTKYFDMAGSGEAWNFDDGTHFDQSAAAFIASITKWKLGIGLPDIESSSADMVNPVLEGTIDDTVITDAKITFTFIVPKAISQNGITELGLFTEDDLLTVLSSFPCVDKDSRVELKVSVEIYRKDLS